MNTNQIRHNFATNLVKLRKSRNMNQTQLGDAINYSFKNISKWENEETIPDVEVLASIATFFNVTIDDLIKECDIVRKANKRHNRIIITLSSCLLPYVLALIIFSILHMCQIPNGYYAFLGGAIASAITAIVFTSLFYKKYFVCGSIIYLVIACALLTMFLINFNTFWLVIIIAAVVSLAIALLFTIKFHKKEIKE